MNQAELDTLLEAAEDISAAAITLFKLLKIKVLVAFPANGSIEIIDAEDDERSTILTFEYSFHFAYFITKLREYFNNPDHD